MKFSRSELEILRSAATHGWYVDDENIVTIARLITLGLVAAESDYESISVRATEAGQKKAARLDLVELVNGILEYSEGGPLNDVGHPRISHNSAVQSGQPCIRGTRITVSAIVSFHEAGYSPDAIIKEYPDLKLEDIKAAIAFDSDSRLKPEGPRP